EPPFLLRLPRLKTALAKRRFSWQLGSGRTLTRDKPSGSPHFCPCIFPGTNRPYFCWKCLTDFSDKESGEFIHAALFQASLPLLIFRARRPLPEGPAFQADEPALSVSGRFRQCHAAPPHTGADHQFGRNAV